MAGPDNAQTVVPGLLVYVEGFRENAFSYMLVLRLIPLFPFFVVNLVPAFLGVPLRSYVLGTLMVSAIGAIVTTIGLWIIGNPYFLALGLLMLFLGVAGLGYLLVRRRGERAADETLRREMEPDPKSGLYIPPAAIDELSEPFGNSVHQTRSGL